jgi:hypothetical protein
MELTSIPDRSSITEATAGRELGAIARLAGEMSADPGFALAQEPLNVGFGVGPSAARRRGHGDDEAVGRVDREPEPA